MFSSGAVEPAPALRLCPYLKWGITGHCEAGSHMAWPKTRYLTPCFNLAQPPKFLSAVRLPTQVFDQVPTDVPKEALTYIARLNTRWGSGSRVGPLPFGSAREGAGSLDFRPLARNQEVFLAWGALWHDSTHHRTFPATLPASSLPRG